MVYAWQKLSNHSLFFCEIVFYAYEFIHNFVIFPDKV